MNSVLYTPIIWDTALCPWLVLPGSSDDDTREKETQLANSSEREMAASSSDIRYELGNTVPPRLGDSTAELKAARTTLSKLLKISDDVINLLLSADELEAQILSDIAEQLLKALKHICELLNKLQADTRHLIGEVICLDSTESITLMYKLHDRFFLSKELAIFFSVAHIWSIGSY